MQTTQLTNEQQREIYNKLHKKDLIELLIEANRLISSLTEKPRTYTYPNRSPYDLGSQGWGGRRFPHIPNR